MITTPSALEDRLLARLHELIGAVERRDGTPPLSDQALADLRSSDVLHLVDRTGDAVLGYGQLSRDSLELVTDQPSVAGEILARVEQQTTGDVLLWSHGRASPYAAIAEARGWRRERVLWQLRRPAGPVPDAPLPSGVHVREFVAGQDEAAWLEVNAAAFAGHAEQGRMSMADLRAREAEAWFDPAGFLLAERDGADGGPELIGFHWTKVHPDGLGEVYVLGVAPAAQGMHLGPALLVLGLRLLAGREVALYVDDDNPVAVRLYRRFGFLEHDVDTQLRYAYRG